MNSKYTLFCRLLKEYLKLTIILPSKISPLLAFPWKYFLVLLLKEQVMGKKKGTTCFRINLLYLKHFFNKSKLSLEPFLIWPLRILREILSLVLQCERSFVPSFFPYRQKKHECQVQQFLQIKFKELLDTNDFACLNYFLRNNTVTVSYNKSN